MIERAIENWLTKTNERNYQAAFCQVLMHQGHKVLFSSSHGPMEQGKDIITVAADGEYCAFQTKTGNVGLSEWRAIQGEVQELIELPIDYPGVDKARIHRAYLVTNGNVTDPVRTQINDRNEDNVRKERQYAHLSVIAKDALLKDFIDAQGKFVPRELPDMRSFLELYLDSGTGMLPKEKLFTVLGNAVFSNGRGAPADARDAVTSSLVIVSYLMNAFEQAENHYAMAEGWIILAACLARYVSKNSISEQHWKESLDLVLREAGANLAHLRDDALKRADLLEGDLRADGGMILRARATIVLGALASLELSGGLRTPHQTRDSLVQFVKDNLKHLWFWGDSAFPYYFHIVRLLESVGEASVADGILKDLFHEVVEANYGRSGAVFALPYYSAEEVLAAALPDRLGATDFTGCIGSSYVLRSICELLVRRGQREFLAARWRKYTYVQQHEFVPERVEDVFAWRTREGANDSRFPDQTQSWADLQSTAGDTASIAELYKRFASILPFYIMVCPHRTTVGIVRILDLEERMRIAILGWGSLVWDPRDLPRVGEWQEGGPLLPIEFSRVSSGRRLTLVIDEDNGVPVKSRFAVSSRTCLAEAIADLQKREGMPTAARVGFVDRRAGTHAARLDAVAQAIISWATEHGFDAVVWADLAPNFRETGKPFSAEAAAEHLRSLAGEPLENAVNYIKKAPVEVDTPVRRCLHDLGLV